MFYKRGSIPSLSKGGSGPPPSTSVPSPSTSVPSPSLPKAPTEKKAVKKSRPSKPTQPVKPTPPPSKSNQVFVGIGRQGHPMLSPSASSSKSHRSKISGKLGKAASKLNPMSYALKNKKSSKLMRDSGRMTNNKALPAVVQVGKAAVIAGAGAAGTMAGGPAGGAVAAGAAKMATDRIPYQPKQKSKTWGQAAGIASQVASSKTRQTMNEQQQYSTKRKSY